MTRKLSQGPAIETAQQLALHEHGGLTFRPNRVGIDGLCWPCTHSTCCTKGENDAKKNSTACQK